VRCREDQYFNTNVTSLRTTMLKTISTGEELCLPCPIHTTAPPDATSAGVCSCNAGYFAQDDGACAACPEGKVKPGVGADTQCVDCVGNTYSNATGASTCVACPASSQATADKVSCVCNTGYTGPYTVCVACEAGKFKDVPGPMDCDACIPGKAHKLPAATSISSCADCIVGTFASEMGTSACTLCAADASSPTSSDQITNCTCNAAYAGPDGGPCTACVAGQYKPAAGSAECESCAAGKYSTTASIICDSCEAGKFCSAYGCLLCLDCAAGRYSTVLGAISPENCSDCPPGTYSSASGNPSFGSCVGYACAHARARERERALSGTFHDHAHWASS
jgi:hypothetical protein